MGLWQSEFESNLSFSLNLTFAGECHTSFGDCEMTTTMLMLAMLATRLQGGLPPGAIDRLGTTTFRHCSAVSAVGFSPDGTHGGAVLDSVYRELVAVGILSHLLV